MHTKLERLLSKSLTTLEVMTYYLVVHKGPGKAERDPQISRSRGGRLASVRTQFFFNTESPKALFRECSPNNIVQFLKQTSRLYLTNYDSTFVHFLSGVLFGVIAVQWGFFVLFCFVLFVFVRLFCCLCVCMFCFLFVCCCFCCCCCFYFAILIAS